MNTNMKHMISTLILSALLAGAAGADEIKQAVEDRQDAEQTGKTLTESANIAAVTDAVKAVLVNTRLDLDIRLKNHTSLASVEGS